MSKEIRPMFHFEVNNSDTDVVYENYDQNISYLKGLIYKAQFLCMAIGKKFGRPAKLDTCMGRLQSVVGDVVDYNDEHQFIMNSAVWERMNEMAEEIEESGRHIPKPSKLYEMVCEERYLQSIDKYKEEEE